MSIMKSSFLKIFLLQLYFGILSFTAFSQDKELISPYIQLQYFKNTDNQVYLQTTLTYSKNRMEIPIHGMEILFFTGDKVKTLLANAVTDEKGIARFPLDENLKLSLNNDGSWSFYSEFKGNDTIEQANSDISVRVMNLEMNLSEADSIKTIGLEATTYQNGKKEPVVGEIIMLYIPRMFSLLPVGEATLDENGKAAVEFPSDIPGDKDGMITIIARLEESPTFGNVEKKTTLPWGVPSSYSMPTTHRALWTKTPPTWMIITLSILLTGVWGHYMFAIISLILIKIDSKKSKKKEKAEKIK